jgi:hypothetical protein
MCGTLHSALSPCSAVCSNNSRDVFDRAAFSRQPVTAYDVGALTDTCCYCGALFFNGESRYLSCCRKGTVTVAIPDIPPDLLALITDSHVHLHIRQYNTALAMASVGYSGQSMGGRPHVDGYGSLKISGRVYHLIGGMMPTDGQSPAWGQLYMLDAADATALRVANANCARLLRPHILQQLHALLRLHNPWIQEFVAAGIEGATELTWSSDDVSARAGMVAVRASTGPRSILVKKQTTGLMEISDRHPLYFPLAYVLLWPTGGVGYSEAMTRCDPQNATVIGKLHELEWARYLLMRRRVVSLMHLCGKLSLEFMCDVWSSIECRNLSYLSTSTIQSQFRSSRFSAIMDQLRGDGGKMHQIGAPMLLPATFTGSPRWYHALFLDALALPTAFHLPDLFITVTCNPEWPEFARVLPVGSSIHDHPDIVARVFWLRFKRVMQDIVDGAVFGEVLSYCYRIEWQLRGLPHAHVLIILRHRITNTEMVDQCVSAEIPDPALEPELHRLVLQFMIHGPCNHSKAPCIVDGECEKNFPKQLQPCTVMVPNCYPCYKRRGLFSAQVRGQQVTDAWVVPYSPYLLYRHQAHINGKIQRYRIIMIDAVTVTTVEIASHLILYKYMYKYCFKPPDHGTINFNEIEAFIAGRTLSSAEAVWRILELPLHREYPSVQRLTVHLPDSHVVVFDPDAGANAAAAAATAATSTLLQWFALNVRDSAARSMLYKDIPRKYIWNKKLKRWDPRKHVRPKVARMHGVACNNIELFMLRRLLLVVRGARSYEDVRTVDGVVYPTFETAVRARGMLDDDLDIYAAFEDVVATTTCDRYLHIFTIAPPIVVLYDNPMYEANLNIAL